MKKISDMDDDNFIVSTLMREADNIYHVKVDFLKKFSSLQEAQKCEMFVYELLQYAQDNQLFKKDENNNFVPLLEINKIVGVNNETENERSK